MHVILLLLFICSCSFQDSCFYILILLRHFVGYFQARYQGQQPYEDQAAAAASLSSTTSMEVNLPLSDDSNSNNRDAHCINVMENFGYMDLLDGSDIWDPPSIFESENPHQQQDEDGFFPDGQQQPSQLQQDQIHQQQTHLQQEDGNDGFYFLQGNNELALIFFEWLKQNKDYISAEEMRSIKLKRATIECALKCLGTTREGKKQLLKLILEWVEQYQLQKKRAREICAAATDSPYDHYPPPATDHTINPNLDADGNCNAVPPDPNTYFSPPRHGLNHLLQLTVSWSLVPHAHMPW